MMNPALPERETDQQLWCRVVDGDPRAFEVLVERHQNLVCSVALGVCGDPALSEDVAQETFWAAWRGRASLLQPERLRSWLCGIARNLGRNAVRRLGPVGTLVPLDALEGPASPDPAPDVALSDRDVATVVRAALERLPEAYRVPLILFYREDQSVAEVAAALDLSEAAVRQRLHRGRTLLRGRVEAMVESGLRQGRPGRRFTVAVMAGLASGSVSQTAMAAAAVPPAAKVAGLLGGAGLLGALGGPLIGLTGGAFGVWLPAQLALTRPDRDRVRRMGRKMIVASLIYVLGLAWAVVLIRWRIGGLWAWAVPVGLTLLFQAYVLVVTLRAARDQRRFHRDNPGPHEPNDSPLRVRLDRELTQLRGRVYRSRLSLFGWPLLDVNVADPLPQSPPEPGRGVARGWIAVGHHARGLVLAIGMFKAVGLIAFGHRAAGAICFGGIAVGGIAVGGMGVGLIGAGGLAIGGLAIGGGAIGVSAAGGGAIAWNTAVGGLAIARHAAYGGLAVAGDFAVGGEGTAAHFDDAPARAALLNHPLKRGMDAMANHPDLFRVLIVVVSIVPMLLTHRLMFRRVPSPAD